MTDATAQAKLKNYVERIEKLDDEKRAISADIAGVKSEAKSDGFDIKAINHILKERRMSRAERQEFQSLVDIYRAALGMLDGTPLGEYARRKLMGEPEDPEPAKTSGEAQQTDIEDGTKTEPAKNAPPPAPTAEDLDAIRAEGREAAAGGKRVMDNPYGHDDVRRACWDEGWCSESGSDGMEIPSAWRRKKPAKG